MISIPATDLLLLNLRCQTWGDGEGGSLTCTGQIDLPATAGPHPLHRKDFELFEKRRIRVEVNLGIETVINLVVEI